jgi:thioredoxin reductase
LERFDLVVVGGGPAGLSAALVAADADLAVVVLEAAPRIGGQLRSADHPIGDLLGLPAPNGESILRAVEAQVRSSRLDVRLGQRVVRVAPAAEGLTVELDAAEPLGARRVLLATGLVPRVLGVPGEAELSVPGRVREAAARFAGRRVIVVGGGDEAANTACVLAAAGAKVVLLVRDRLRARRAFRSELWASPRVEVRTGSPIRAFEGSGGRLEAVLLASGERIAADAAVVRIGAEPVLPKVEPLLVAWPDGRVRTDDAGRTSAPRVFAAGDLVVTAERRYVAVAMGLGTIAARAIAEELE